MTTSIIHCKGSYSRVLSVSILALAVITATLGVVAFNDGILKGDSGIFYDSMNTYHQGTETYLFKQGEKVTFQAEIKESCPENLFEITVLNPDGTVILTDMENDVNDIFTYSFILLENAMPGTWKIEFNDGQFSGYLNFNVYHKTAQISMPEDDALVSEYSDFMFSNNGDTLCVGYVDGGNDQQDYEVRSFLKFPLYLPMDEEFQDEPVYILDARLHLNHLGSEDAPNTINIHEVTSDEWDEDSIRWWNQPAHGQDLDYNMIEQTLGGYIWNNDGLLNQVIEEYDNEEKYLSLALIGGENDHLYKHWFNDKESNDEGVDVSPYLEIVYDYRPPVIDKHVDYPHVGPFEDDSYYVTSQTDITADVTDLHDPDPTTYYSMVPLGDESSLQLWNDPSTNPIHFPDEGVWRLDIRANDSWGHVSWHNETFYVDNTPSTQEVILGEPQTPSTVNIDGEILTIINDHTPIWLSSEDPEIEIGDPEIPGVGTDYVQYDIYWKNGLYDQWVLIKESDPIQDSDSKNGINVEMFISDLYGNLDYQPPDYINGTGFYQIHLKCWDKLGNYDFTEKVFLVDTVDPHVSKIVGSPNCGDDYKITTTTPLTFDGHDPGQWWVAGVEKICFEIQPTCTGMERTDEGEGPQWPITGCVPKGDYITFGDFGIHSGEYSITFWAVDYVENEGIDSGREKWQLHCVDELPPETFLTFNEPVCTHDQIPYITSNTEINLTAYDNPECCDHSNYDLTTYYRIWINSTEAKGWTDWMIYDGSNFTLNDININEPWNGECNHSIQYYSVDCLGNNESGENWEHIEMNNDSFRVDNTPPRVSLEWSTPRHEREGMEFVTTETIFWINATDDQGLCNVDELTIEYDIEDIEIFEGCWNENTLLAFTINKACQHEIIFNVSDCLGNKNTEYYDNPQIVYVDEENPETESYYTDPHYIKENTDYITSDTVKHIYVTDTGCNVGGAGTNKVYWKVTDKDDLVVDEGWVYDEIYTAESKPFEDEIVIVSTDLDPVHGQIHFTIQLKEECKHFIYHQGIDYLGNSGPTIKQPVRVDDTPPATEEYYMNNPVGWKHPYNNWDDFVDAELSDGLPWIKCDLKLIADDSIGPCEAGTKYIFWRHTQPCEENPPDDQSVNTMTGQQFQQLFGCNDPRIIDHTWNYATGSFTEFCLEYCMNNIYYFSMDHLHNYGMPMTASSPEKDRLRHVDCTPPVVTKTFYGTPTYGTDDYWIRSDTWINITANEEYIPALCQSGLNDFTVDVYSIDTEGYSSYIGSPTIHSINEYLRYCNFTIGDFTEAPGCEYEIRIRATDHLGNVHYDPQHHKIDDTPPRLLVWKPVNGWYAEGDEIDIRVDCWDRPSDCHTGIEDGKQATAYLVIKDSWNGEMTDTDNLILLNGELTYDADNELISGTVTVPTGTGVETEELVTLLVVIDDNVGNSGYSLETWMNDGCPQDWENYQMPHMVLNNNIMWEWKLVTLSEEPEEGTIAIDDVIESFEDRIQIIYKRDTVMSYDPEYGLNDLQYFEFGVDYWIKMKGDLPSGCVLEEVLPPTE